MLAAIALLSVPAAVALAHGAPSSDEATFAKRVPVGVDSEARSWQLGGFSALYPLDREGHRFVTLTDRGPNGDITCDGVDGKEIFVPAYAPRLIEFSVDHGRITLDRVRPFRVGSQLTTGLANLPGDESSFTSSCKLLPKDPFGIDSEGIAVDPRSGRKPSYWISDEYRPSILLAGYHGDLLTRIVPQGATGAAYTAAVDQAEADSGNTLDVITAFPAIVGDRFRKNRGFEDVAVQRFNGRTYVYTALQSPMENPDKSTRNSLALRVFRIDVTRVDKPVVDREWVHLLAIKPGKKSPLADKGSAFWPAGPDKLLIEERDDALTNDPSGSTRIYRVDFTKATNLLGGAYDDGATTPTLEQLYLSSVDGVVPADPADVKPGKRSLCVDVDAALTDAGLVNQKLEGIALVGSGKQTRLALVDDNDFDLLHVTDPVTNPDSVPTKIDFVPLPGGCGL
ncbi:MAG TPA: esterase-like activity of phytase family protein [Thermoleophilaceae bacterium]